MKGGDGYALDLLTPVRHVATMIEGAGPDGPAPTVEAMTAAYRHSVTSDLSRIREHEGAADDLEARRWLIRKALEGLGKQVRQDGDGWRLTRPLGKVRYKRRVIIELVSEDQADEKRALRAAYNDLSNDRWFQLTIAGARGATRTARLTLHPLARAIPQMDEKAFLELAADVKAHGVKMPLVVIGDQVLDGRHRAAAAAALKLPVQVTEFAGDEAAARDMVVSLNVQRRHLTTAQRTLIVQELFLPEAEAEAQQRMLAGTVDESSQTTLAPTGARVPTGKKATQVAAERSLGLTTARSLERMEPVRRAPRTQERIRRGEIKTAPDARREALKETQQEAPADVEALAPKPAYSELGQALAHIRNARERIEIGDLGGERGSGVTAEKFSQRITDLRDAVDQVEKLLQEKQVIQP